MSDNKDTSNENNNLRVETPSMLRRIRSFVIREGRLTPGQEKALADYFPKWGIPFEKSLVDWNQVFERASQHLCIEIGFGMGTSLAEQAKNRPDTDFLGIEVHKPGVGACLLLAAQNQSTNVRVANYDAVEFIEERVPDESVDTFQVFFPDPWHKRKHHKRRIVQPEFIQRLVTKLKVGGCLHLATDWEDYAKHMVKVINANAQLTNLSSTNDYVERPEHRPLTKFEKRGHRLGHGVWDLMYRREK
ncbi:MAG: tRNA (guanosine(46)-N7)-methyltransferase TrmB [Pseudomonadota bacterium]